MERKIRVRSIIFTEACPLACRYCDLKNGPVFGQSPAMTKDQIFSLVEKFDKLDDYNKIDTRLLFTGGEPLLYWDWIKEIIEKYGHRFQYMFNTSGYLFTEEILEYLSNYTTNFVLSVDGNEKLTNYLRPVCNSLTKTGYFKQLKTIIPTLLYYFPQTPFRIIINPRYADMLYEMYVEATRLGFKYFTYLLDFESRPGRIIPKDKKIIYWEEKYTKILEEQMNLILEDIIQGYIKGISRPRVTDLDKAIKFLLDNKTFDPDNLPCQVFNERTLNTLYNPEISNNCFSGCFSCLNDVKQELIKAYNNHSHICDKDSSCQAFEYCALICCPQNSYTQRSGFFDFDDLECVVNKISYYSAIKLLTLCNELCPNAKLYNQYINSFNYPEKQEVFL